MLFVQDFPPVWRNLIDELKEDIPDPVPVPDDE
jgi:hypothetical protein